MYIYIYICMCICIYMYKYVCMCIFVCMYVCVYIYMYVKSMSVLLRYQQLIRKVCSKDADAATVKQLSPIRGTCFFW